MIACDRADSQLIMTCRYTNMFVGQTQVEEHHITSSIALQQCHTYNGAGIYRPVSEGIGKVSWACHAPQVHG